MLTQRDLQEFVRDKFRDYRLILVSNREPYLHRRAGKGVECIQPASGMATALDPMMRSCGGTWIAHGAGDADRQVSGPTSRVAVPPDDPKYTLRRVWLTKEQEQRYYYGLSNQGLWPLCHVVFRRPVFDPRDWAAYREVNALFADAVIEEAGAGPAFVFIQDYHFALLPRMLKERNPRLAVAQFWHIPWPNRETFRVFPWGQELLDGLLGNDLLGFHLNYHCTNFLETVERNLESHVDLEKWRINRQGHATSVRPFPVSIDVERHEREAVSPAVEKQMRRWRQELRLGREHLGIGIDRLDYTKGIPERLRSIDRLLEKHPDLVGRVRFLQVGVPSRVHIAEYKGLGEQVRALVDQINWRWSAEDWTPIVLVDRHLGQTDMMALHRLARFCFVSSLHDGMNLVAKEFVSSRLDDDGVLILSRFAGSARELTDALLVNPYDLDECADALYAALQMPDEERRWRMQRMRAEVAENTVYRWAIDILSLLLKLDQTLPADASGAGA